MQTISDTLGVARGNVAKIAVSMSRCESDICTYTFKIKSRQVYVGIHPTFGEAGRWTTISSRGQA
jgi:hypothetical protein